MLHPKEAQQLFHYIKSKPDFRQGTAQVAKYSTKAKNTAPNTSSPEAILIMWLSLRLGSIGSCTAIALSNAAISLAVGLVIAVTRNKAMYEAAVDQMTG